MENNKSSMTALISAFARAYHAENDLPKIFNDTLAREFLTDEEYTLVVSNMLAGLAYFKPENNLTFANDQEALKWVVQTRLAPITLARASYCEEMLQNAIMLGVNQYVILGAGMDTFAYRHPELLKKLHVFELDHPATQAFKRSRIESLGWEISEHYHQVPIDFTSDNLVDTLSKAGFNSNERAYFSWLGVTYYLSQDKIMDVLKSIASIARKGSTLMFDYPDENLFKSEVSRVKNMLAMAAASGEPMKSCFSYPELEALLEQAGFLIYEHLSPIDIEERYFSRRKDYLHAFESIAFALAIVQ